MDDGGVDDETGGDVVEEDEEGVGAEVHVWDEEAADGAIVEGTLEPLGGVGVGGVFVEVGEMTAETAEAFGAHGIAFWVHLSGFGFDKLIRVGKDVL